MCCFPQPFKADHVKVSHVVFTNSTKYLAALTQKLLFHVLLLPALQSLPCCFHQQHKVTSSSYPEAVVPCAVSLSPSKSAMLVSHVVFTNSTKYLVALTQKLFHVPFLSALQSLPCCFQKQHKVFSSSYSQAVPCAISLSPSKPPMLFSEAAQSIQ